MDYRSIITILKGDVVGHEFHGNQWLTVSGGFNAGGNGRAPRAPRAPRVPQSVKQVVQSIKGGGKFLALKTNKIAKLLGNPMKLGGAFNKGWQKVEMEDGSIAGVKTAKNSYGGDATVDIQSEILASAVGKALGMPIREALPVDGHPDQCVTPWIEGQPLPYNASIDSASPEDQASLNQLRFFDQLIGNSDRFLPDGTIVNPANIMRSYDGQIVGIDHAMAFDGGSIPRFSLLGNPSQEDIKGMYKSLTDLQPTFASIGRMKAYTDMMDRFRTGFVNYVPA
jgi:hypothetical protein